MDTPKPPIFEKVILDPYLEWPSITKPSDPYVPEALQGEPDLYTPIAIEPAAPEDPYTPLPKP